jgi:hypothetical protein
MNPEFWPSNGPPSWHSTINNDMLHLRGMGFFAVRWFILGDGGHYGQLPRLDEHGVWHMDDIPRARPRRGNDHKWYVDSVSQLTPEFMDDFIRMVRAVSNAHMKLIPTLIDFGFCFDGDPTGRSLVKCGRYELINDDAKRAQFLDLTLRALVDRVNREGLQSTIYAWELINEPEWCTNVLWPLSSSSLPASWLLLESIARTGWSNTRQPNVPLDKMKAFIREGCSIINGARFRSTVGFSAYDSPRDLTGSVHGWNDAELGVTLHQCHFYGDLDNLDNHIWSHEFPCILGELPDGRRMVTEESGEQQLLSLYARLHKVAERGYPAVFIWPMHKPQGAPPPFDYLSVEDQADVRRYVSEGSESPEGPVG